ncbi:MAG: hypothetical protein VYC57_02935 [Verrucomicrobiota bacterium]|nr:hypothetical protein [Verrucomicrobiota bacterium]
MKLQASTLVRTPVLSLPRLATAEGPTVLAKDHKAIPAMARKETWFQLIASSDDSRGGRMAAWRS